MVLAYVGRTGVGGAGAAGAAGGDTAVEARLVTGAICAVHP
jgi:hypothetical protein